MGIKLQSGSGDLKNNDIKSYILSSIQIPLWNKYLKPRLIDLGLKTKSHIQVGQKEQVKCGKIPSIFLTSRHTCRSEGLA